MRKPKQIEENNTKKQKPQMKKDKTKNSKIFDMLLTERINQDITNDLSWLRATRRGSPRMESVAWRSQAFCYDI